MEKLYQIVFLNKYGHIDYLREVTYVNGVPSFRYMDGKFRPIGKRDLKRPCYYHANGLQYAESAESVIGDGLFKVKE